MVWDELIARTSGDSQLTFTYLAFLTLACLIAVVGATTGAWQTAGESALQLLGNLVGIALAGCSPWGCALDITPVTSSDH